MLACERHGSGEPLVLVHGVTHRRQAWYPVLDLLTPHREVVLVDLPGHGDSPPLRTGGRPVEDVLRGRSSRSWTSRASTGRTSPATRSAAASRSRPASTATPAASPRSRRPGSGPTRRPSPTRGSCSPPAPRSSSGSARAPSGWRTRARPAPDVRRAHGPPGPASPPITPSATSARSATPCQHCASCSPPRAVRRADPGTHPGDRRLGRPRSRAAALAGRRRQAGPAARRAPA